MTRNFIRNLIVCTIANVTGDDIEEVLDAEVVELDTRNWEQIFGRLEATLDVTSGWLLSTERSIDIDALARTLDERLAMGAFAAGR